MRTEEIISSIGPMNEFDIKSSVVKVQERCCPVFKSNKDNNSNLSCTSDPQVGWEYFNESEWSTNNIHTVSFGYARYRTSQTCIYVGQHQSEWIQGREGSTSLIPQSHEGANLTDF